MFSNPAFDVALGLVFIYALYSLLATTISELISTMFNNRGELLKKGLQHMLDEVPVHSSSKGTTTNVNLLSNIFFNRPEIKYLGRQKRNGNFRFPSYMKASTFAKGLLNALSTTNPVSHSIAAHNIKLNKNKETDKFLLNLISEADDNVERFKTLAEEWFDDTMDRVGGWYKRRIQLITFIVGLVIAFSMNVDTIAIAKKLSTDTKARLAMVEAATTYITSMDSVQLQDSTTSNNVDSLNKQIQVIMKEVNTADAILANSYPESGDGFWVYLSSILGCMLTAVALSVGSPFWFDLLNKLIKLRGSGTPVASKNTPIKKQPVG